MNPLLSSFQVAAAALSSLAEVIKAPSCCRLFEGYLERVLPLVFGRLIDTKDNIRHAAARVLDVSPDKVPVLCTSYGKSGFEARRLGETCTSLVGDQRWLEVRSLHMLRKRFSVS